MQKSRENLKLNHDKMTRAVSMAREDMCKICVECSTREKQPVPVFCTIRLHITFCPLPSLIFFNATVLVLLLSISI